MLRLAHRILTQPVQCRDIRTVESVRAELEECPSLICDDVWMYARDVELNGFCVPPALPSVFCERNVVLGDTQGDHTRGQIGVLVTSMPFDMVPEQRCRQEWGAIPASYYTTRSCILWKNGSASVSTDIAIVGLDEKFRIMMPFIFMWSRDDRVLSQSARDIMQDNILYESKVALTAVAMMNARGVILEDATEADGVPTEKWIRRQKTKSIVYKVLNLTGVPRSEQRHQNTLHSEDGLDGKKRHIVRGNFATYTPEKPHVSGYVGNMWRAAHMRGDDKHGVVVKDYALTAPQE